MKKIQKAIACCLGVIATILFCSCGYFGAKELSVPAKAERLDYKERKEENYLAFKQATDEFSAKLTEGVYKISEKDENLAIAPLSVYMALALATECADGDTRTELLSALGVSYEMLKANVSKLYRALNVEHKTSGVIGEKTLGKVNMTNSIWIDKSLEIKQACLDSLSQDYYAYSYQTDFLNKPNLANQAIESFIKRQTNGLIDEDMNFDDETLFVLMNTLYLKDVWNEYGKDIARTENPYTFKECDGETENLRFLQGKYISGRAYQGEGYTSFYTQTYNGYKIKFILPDEGKMMDEVFTSENIYTLNAVTDYSEIDDEKREEYYTRCLFPEFESEYDGDVSTILQNDFEIKSIFDIRACNLTNLTSSSPVFCPEVRHVAELKVDKKGIEGAAVTVMPKAGAPGPGEYTQVYLDFIVDRTFGFVLTDSYDTVLFTGVIGDV